MIKTNTKINRLLTLNIVVICSSRERIFKPKLYDSLAPIPNCIWADSTTASEHLFYITTVVSVVTEIDAQKRFEPFTDGF